MYKACQMQTVSRCNTPPPFPKCMRNNVVSTPASVTSFTVSRVIMKIFFRRNQVEVQHPGRCATPYLRITLCTMAFHNNVLQSPFVSSFIAQDCLHTRAATHRNIFFSGQQVKSLSMWCVVR